VASAISPVMDNLITEVRRAIIFFTNHNPSASIKRVVMSGGTALMPNLLPYMANKLDLEVLLANPLNGIEISPKLEKKKTGAYGGCRQLFFGHWISPKRS